MSLIDAALSAFLQAAVLGGVPLFVYVLYQKLRHKRPLAESARRAGLQIGSPRYLPYSVAFALGGIAIIVLIFAVWGRSLFQSPKIATNQNELHGKKVAYRQAAGYEL